MKKQQEHPHLFDFLPPLVGLGVCRFAIVPPQRWLQQTPVELLEIKSIRVGLAVSGGHPLRRGLRRFGPGYGQLLLRSASVCVLVGCRGFADHFGFGARVPFGRSQAPLLLLLGSLHGDIVLGPGADRDGLDLRLGEENALQSDGVGQKEEGSKAQGDQTGEEEEKNEFLGQAQTHARCRDTGQLSENH